MLFDTLCQLIEDKFPDKRKMLEDAHIFRMDKGKSDKPASTAMDDWDDDEQVIENVRLPFSTIAIEDVDRRDTKGSVCFVLSEKNAEDRVWEVILLSADHITFGDVIAFPRGLTAKGIVEHPVSFKTLVSVNLKMNKIVAREVDLHEAPEHVEFTFDPDTLPDSVEERWEAAGVLLKQIRTIGITDAFIAASKAAIAAVVISSPSTFVVEESNAECNKQFPKAKIRRSRYRPHYIVLTPQEIKHRFIHDEHGTHATPRPHERRGHWRRFTSERFVNKVGQVTWIKAMWVGPQEGVVGKNKYRVRIDV